MNDILMNVGDSTNLTFNFNSPLDAAPTVTVTGGNGPITLGPVVPAGGNSYSVLVTATATGIATVTCVGKVNGVSTTLVSGLITIGTLATTITLTGPTTPTMLDQPYTYTLTVNGMVDPNSASVLWSAIVSPGAPLSASALCSKGLLESVPLNNGNAWQIPITFLGASGGAQVQLFGSVTVNGVALTTTLIVTVPTPVLTITPATVNLTTSGNPATITIKANFVPSDPPIASSSGNTTVSSLNMVYNNVWTAIVSPDTAGAGTVTLTTTQYGAIVTAQITTSVVTSVTGTASFSPPSIPIIPPPPPPMPQ